MNSIADVNIFVKLLLAFWLEVSTGFTETTGAEATGIGDIGALGVVCITVVCVLKDTHPQSTIDFKMTAQPI